MKKEFLIKMNKKRTKPNVLVAGFPRCGSTYIYNLLKQHPEIFIPGIKEINYFNKDHFFLFNPEILNPRYFKSRNWYYNFFKTNKKIVIDFSILCSLDSSSAKRVKKELGDIKILFITRKKEDYLSSILKGMKNWGEIYKDYKDYGDVDYFIDNYKKIFSRVYIFSIDIFNKNPHVELKKLLKFLGAKDFKFNLDVNPHITPSEAKPSFLVFLRRKIYVGLTKIFYSLISLFVIASAKPEKSKSI